MNQKSYSFSAASTTCYFDAEFDLLNNIVERSSSVIITDENIFQAHRSKFQGWKLIVLPAGEKFKTQATVDHIIQQLIALGADRKFTLVGVGGGVVTDVTGYAAAIYMRGLRFGFVPVSLLAMVDASIGGKNGVDVGPYKNLVGTIRQPEFLLYDSSFLQSLPHEEWVNGFAEIIKHACIKDAEMFRELENNNVGFYQTNASALDELVSRNAMIKAGVVMHDEFEKGDRKLLNFGHTWGHAIETKLNIPHGHAISIGMVVAAEISETITGFSGTPRLVRLLQQYELPIDAQVNKEEVFEILKMDKKKDSAAMNYVLLNEIGDAIVQKIPIDELEKMIYQCK